MPAGPLYREQQQHEWVEQQEDRGVLAVAILILIVIGVGALLGGCALRRERVCPDPCPRPTTCPTPTPTPAPTPHPTPAPTPHPTPPPGATCQKVIGPYNCSEPPAAVAEYQQVVLNALKRITGGRTEVQYSELLQRQILLQLMVDLNASGWCTSYDLQGGNDSQASEMGCCLGQGGDHCSWFQVFASAGHVRWDGMFRSACSPVAMEEMVEEVAAAWGLPVPPPFGPGPLGRRRRPGPPTR